MAVADASLRISMLTISAGLMVARGEIVETLPLPRPPRPKSAAEFPPPWTMTPSMTYRGSALALTVAWPRTRMDEDEPGAPEVWTAVTPAARHCRDWSRFVMMEPFRSSSFIETEAPERSLLFIVPYPTTTTSSRNWVSSPRTTLMTDWLPTAISWDA